MADEDDELFASAMTDEAPQEPQEQPRDDKGRFAAKSEPEGVDTAPAEEVAPVEKPEPPKPKEDHGIPSWRLKEEADARRAAEERYSQTASQLADMQRMIAEMRTQNKQPEKIPDIFEDAPGFVSHQVKSNLDPINQQMAQLREFYSRRDAEREFGAEKVKAAYDAIAQGLQSRDPEATGIYQRAMQSLDPYGDIMRWHQQKAVFSQIGSDPNAWFEKHLEERMKDPAYQAKLLESIKGQIKPGQRPVTQLPPSLNKVAAAVSSDDDGEDNSEAGLLKSALRR